MSPSLTDRDRRVIWHPFTQHGLARDPLPIKRAQGVWLELEDGRKILDGISSWWVNIHGHGHPVIAQAIAQQASQLEHVIFAGFTHEPAVRLAENLSQALQARGTQLTRAFYSDNGSTAVEVALKMALQYQYLRGRTARRKLLALRDSYHGDTWGSMSVSEPEGFHAKFRDLLVPVDFIRAGDFEEASARLGSDSPYAALIVEPMVQGAGGMRIHEPEYLRRLAELCRESGTLLICDEVFTGFHRTGPLFAFEHAGIAPDLLCLSKGLTGGFLPLSVTMATEKIFEAFLSPEISKAFLHGHSYTANPVACAAALASWELLQLPQTQMQLEAIARIHQKRLASLASRGIGRNHRGLGTLAVVDHPTLAPYGSDHSSALYEAALQRGALIRPLGGTLYLLPPYCITEVELGRLWDIVEELLALFPTPLQPSSF
jgi:adenosylmethionine-8-amino-7-oxononanoate aminotransferase